MNDSFIRVLLSFLLIAYIDRQPTSFSSASTSLYRMGHSIYLRRKSIYVCMISRISFLGITERSENE